jgi:hypothetical protein
MAAECIMTGEPEVVKARLRAIAPTPYWRNVFLFAASKCFVDTQSRHLQDAIRLLCEDLNAPSDVLLEAVRAGSELAADIMQSGAVAENPNHARHLARIALALLSEPYLIDREEQEVPVDQKLAGVYSETVRTVYLPELSLRIGQTDVGKTMGGWSLLTRPVRARVDWAVELADRGWPPDPKSQMRLILNSPPELLDTPWLVKKLERTFWKVPPSVALPLRWHRPDFGAVCRRSDSLRPAAHYFSDGMQAKLKIGPELIDGIAVSVNPAFPTARRETNGTNVPIPLDCHTAWLPLRLAREFLRSPNAETLWDALDEIADRAWDTHESWPLDALPWPLANCLGAARDVDGLRNIARQTREGALGDGTDWAATEKSWVTEGININTVRGLPEKDLSLDERGHLGLPDSFGASIARQAYKARVRRDLLRAAQQATSLRARDTLAWLWAHASVEDTAPDEISPDDFRDLCALCRYSIWSYANTDDPLTTTWLRVFDYLGRLDNLGLQQLDQPKVRTWAVPFQIAFVKGDAADPTFGFGLLRLLGRMAAIGIPIDFIPGEMLKIDPSAGANYAKPCYSLASILIKLTHTTLTAAGAAELAMEATAALEHPLAEPNTADLIFATAKSHLDHVPEIVEFLLRLRQTIPSGVELGVAQCDRILRRAVRGRVSELHPDHRLGIMMLPVIPQH